MAEREKEQVEVRTGAPEDVGKIGAEGRQDRGVTLRAILFGFCISIGVCLLDDTVRYVMHGSHMAHDNMPMANLILFLLSVLGCAALARWFGSRFAFSPTEWITVFCMGFISALGPTNGVSGYLIGLIVTPYFLATQENQWARYLQPYLPTWLIPTDDGSVMTWYFGGLPRGASIPWGVWAISLLWWFTFICAVVLACACASILIHRQWSENERLIYPMMTPILEMATGAGTGQRALPEFMTGKAFWAGFGLTSFTFGWNMIAWFYPEFPTFPTSSWKWIFYSEHYPPLFVNLSTMVICFSYFASLDILFSLWFFDLLFILEGGFLTRIGISATSPHYGIKVYAYQTAGGFVSLVLWGLYVARLHLRDAFRKALHPESPHIDDSRELLSYRGAFIGLIISCLYMAVWLGRAGMEVKAILVLIPAMFIVYLGVAKILAYSGLIYITPPTSAWEISVAAFGGTAALKPITHAAFGLSAFALSHYRCFAMPVMAHVNRLGDFVTQDKRRLFWAVCAAFVVGMVVSTLYMIWLGYTMGAYNFEPNWLIVHGGRRQFETVVVPAIQNPSSMEADNYWFFLTGAGAMAFLNLMRYRFVWWPFHPIGFALSGTTFARLTGSTILVAWLVKLVMLKLAGPSFYRKSRPFFIGMLIGYILIVAAGVVVDAIYFPIEGHEIHKWY